MRIWFVTLLNVTCVHLDRLTPPKWITLIKMGSIGEFLFFCDCLNAKVSQVPVLFLTNLRLNRSTQSVQESSASWYFCRSILLSFLYCSVCVYLRLFLSHQPLSLLPFVFRCSVSVYKSSPLPTPSLPLAICPSSVLTPVSLPLPPLFFLLLRLHPLLSLLLSVSLFLSKITGPDPEAVKRHRESKTSTV